MVTTKCRRTTPAGAAGGPHPGDRSSTKPSWSAPIVESLLAEFSARLPERLIIGVIATYAMCFTDRDDPGVATMAAVERASRAALASRVMALGDARRQT